MNQHRTQPRKTWGLLALVLVSTGLVACRSARGGPVNVYTSAEGAPSIEAEENNRQISNFLEIQNYVSERRDGWLKVQFDLFNRHSANREIEWQVEWFDASGLSVGRTREWKREVLPGYGYKTVSLTGGTPEATSFRLQTRPPTEHY